MISECQRRGGERNGKDTKEKNDMSKRANADLQEAWLVIRHRSPAQSWPATTSMSSAFDSCCGPRARQRSPVWTTCAPVRPSLILPTFLRLRLRLRLHLRFLPPIRSQYPFAALSHLLFADSSVV